MAINFLIALYSFVTALAIFIVQSFTDAKPSLDDREIENTQVLKQVNLNRALHTLNFQDLKHLNPKKLLIIHDSHNQSLGLTNQLARVIQLIKLGCREGAYVREHHFRLDYSKHVYGELDDLVDIKKTNANLKCTRLIRKSEVQIFDRKIIKNDAQLKLPWLIFHNDSSVYQKLVFVDNNSNRWVAFNGFKIPTMFYSIHFRMEIDWIISRVSRGLYLKWLDIVKSKISDSSKGDKISHIENGILDAPGVKNQILQHIYKYEKLVVKKFIDRSYPVMIATGLGKNDSSNIRCEWILTYFLKFLKNKGYRYVLGSSVSPHREIKAVADMKMMINSVNCIIDDQSTFSVLVNIMRGSKTNSKEKAKMRCTSVAPLKLTLVSREDLYTSIKQADIVSK